MYKPAFHFLSRQNCSSKAGSVLVLSIILLAIISLEVMALGMQLTKSFGIEATLLTNNLAARRAAEAAITTTKTEVANHYSANPRANLATTFTQASSPLTTLSIFNPETGTNQASPISVQGWVYSAPQAGSNYVEIAGRALVGGVDLTLKQWVKLENCRPGLTTILNNKTLAHFPSAVDPDSGYVFFTHSGDGKAYAWHPVLGLTTLASFSTSNIVTINPKTGWFATGTQDNRAFFWHPYHGTRFVTVPAQTSLLITPFDKYFMLYPYVMATGSNAYAWSYAGGLTTILSDVQMVEYERPLANKQLYVFSGIKDSANIYDPAMHSVFTWSPGAGLQTIYTTTMVLSMPFTINTDEPTVYFSSRIGQIYRYDASKGVDTRNLPYLQETGRYYLPYQSTPFNSGFLWFADSTTANNEILNFWSPTISTTILSRNFSSGSEHFYMPTQRLDFQNPANGDFYITEDSSSANFYVYNPSLGLTTLVSNRADVGNRLLSTLIDNPNDGYVAFSDYGNGGGDNVYVWSRTLGLTSILTGITTPGISAVDPAKNRVFIGSFDTSNAANLYLWSPLQGLTTLLPNRGRVASAFSSIDTHSGRFYFADMPSTGTANFYVWTPNDACDVGHN